MREPRRNATHVTDEGQRGRVAFQSDICMGVHVMRFSPQSQNLVWREAAEDTLEEAMLRHLVGTREIR